MSAPSPRPLFPYHGSVRPLPCTIPDPLVSKRPTSSRLVNCTGICCSSRPEASSYLLLCFPISLARALPLLRLPPRPLFLSFFHALHRITVGLVPAQQPPKPPRALSLPASAGQTVNTTAHIPTTVGASDPRYASATGEHSLFSCIPLPPSRRSYRNARAPACRSCC